MASFGMLLILFGIIGIPVIAGIVAAIATVVSAAAFVGGAREEEE